MNQREIELKILDNTNQVVLVDSETKQMVGSQIKTVVTTESEAGWTYVTATFEIPPRKK